MNRLLLALLLLRTSQAMSADVAVLTQHNDLARSGANLNEQILNVRNVNANQFGLLFARDVDDQIYAQPLIVTHVNLGARGVHNLVIVATVNDSVFAFDADDATDAAPCWRTSFLDENTVAPNAADMTDACGGEYADFKGNIGIVSTPVVDPAKGAIYLVARTKEHGTHFVQRLHALDVRTGSELPGSPVVIAATYPGHGSGNVGGVITFDPKRGNQRAGLALVKGVVYITWSSHCDWGPYHGWLMGYDAASLRQTVVFNTTPDGENGGIWMSGQAPAADAQGNLFLAVGNGTVGTGADHDNVVNRGESLLRLTPSGGSMRVTSWFTPHNWQDLENTDNDFGNSGVLLIPGTALAFCGTKEGKVYLVNRDHMNGLSHANSDTNAVQSFQVTPPGSSYGLYGTPIWWDGPGGSFAYLWCKQDYLRQYQFDPASGKFRLPEFARGPGPEVAPMPGGILSLSANGRKSGTGIVWASHPFKCDANQTVCPGILRAYDAENVGRELWNSDLAGGRDAVGSFAKFVPPTVANGRVYLATFSKRLNVYGLLPATH